MSTIAISYPLALPTSPAPTDTDINLDYLVGFEPSEFSGAGDAQDWGGRFWRGKIVLPAMTRAQADPWLVFFSKLRGRYGHFLMGDWDRRTARGTATAAAVNGLSQTGNGLVVDGMGNARTLLEGDLFQLENRLYRIVADVTSDGSGNATLQFEPELRSAPADNAVLILSAPKGLFRLAQNYVPNPTDFNGIARLSFDCIEKLP